MAHILIVGDDRAFRVVLAEVLRDGGHDVTAVGDGYRALTVVAGRRTDLVVTAYRMPPPDGIRLLEMFRTQGVVVPAILVSAHPVATPHPADAVLTKPFDVDDLLAAIDRLLRV